MRALLWMGMAVVVAGCGSDVPMSESHPDREQIQQQARLFVDALRPQRTARPVIAVLALNDATETTDFLLTHGVLQRSGVADVKAVAPRAGRVSLYPALEIDGAQDLAGFDQEHPEGADYVIVPAMSDDDDPAITSWLRQQHEKGARVIGVCAGALVVGRAGLLDGRRFATHWYYREDVLDRHPTAIYVPHQRYVIDRGVATTTGITASVPTMLALVEAIGGREKAEALAADLGVDAWTPEHDSSKFGLDAARMTSFVMNKIAFWRHEDWTIDAYDGIDDIALAFAADSWSRTGRIDVRASAPGYVKLRSGLTLVTQPPVEDLPRLPVVPSFKPMQQLDSTLCEIGQRFGDERREWVMMELEYPNRDVCQTPESGRPGERQESRHPGAGREPE